MPTTLYWYLFIDDKTGEQAVVNSSETALPKPLIGELVSVNAGGKSVSGTIAKVTLDIVQDAAGNRTLTYHVHLN